MYNLSHDRDVEAMSLIDKVYDEKENRDHILENLKLQCQKKDKTKTNYWKALFGKRHLKTTIIALILTTFAQ
jgi:predicted DNA-binding ribbon-helix-helix protein